MYNYLCAVSVEFSILYDSRLSQPPMQGQIYLFFKTEKEIKYEEVLHIANWEFYFSKCCKILNLFFNIPTRSWNLKCCFERRFLEHSFVTIVIYTNGAPHNPIRHSCGWITSPLCLRHCDVWVWVRVQLWRWWRGEVPSLVPRPINGLYVWRK